VTHLTDRGACGPGSRWVRHGRLLAAALGMSVVLTGCLPENGISSKAHDVHNLFFVTVALATPVLVGIEGWLLYSVVRYRKRDDREPPQSFGDSRRGLLVLFAVPTAIVAVLFPFGEATLSRVQQRDPHPSVEINVQGFQWEWTFDYLHEGITETGVTLVKPAVMVVPVDEPVHIRLTSRDVMHEFFVRDLLFMRNALPGHQNDFSFTPDTLGTFGGQCAEFCGLNHDRMTFVLKVVTREEYVNWVTAEKAKASTANCAPQADGSSLTAVAQNIHWNTTCFAIRAARSYRVTVDNRDPGIQHNFAVYDSRSLKVTYLQTPKLTGVATEVADGSALRAGRYYFECDVHGPSMSGVLIVK
jgi:cytochrome c oxidase subunit 2